MNSPVAPKISQGTRARNSASPATTTSQAPTSPPARLETTSAISTRLVRDPSSRRNAQPALSDPGTRATVLVAFAATGLTPAASSAGKVSKVPPPARAFIAPATMEVRNRKRR
jgi:hypothetical protein